MLRRRASPCARRQRWGTSALNQTTHHAA